MGLTAHDIHTGAIPDDQVQREVGGLAGGLAGSSAAGRLAGKFTGRLPGPVGFFARLLSAVAGFMGGESAGRVATDAIFSPGWYSEQSAREAQRILDMIPEHDPSAPPDIPRNWRGVGKGEKNRGRLDIGQNEPEVWTPPALPADLDSGARSTERGRLDIGRAVKIDTLIGTVNVNSSATDPREVAEEVADEIERRLRGRGAFLRDVLRADPTPELQY